jgi:2-hydroxychromene-2-carboxylate isomerase
MRIDALAAGAQIEVRWQPFNLREILMEQNNAAFTKNEVKMNSFWHDVERRAHGHGIPCAGRARYLADPDLLALRPACRNDSRAGGMVRGIFARNVSVGSLVDAPRASATVSSASLLPSTSRRFDYCACQKRERLLLQQATDAARKLGIFGAPTFAIGQEIFGGMTGWKRHWILRRERSIEPQLATRFSLRFIKLLDELGKIGFVLQYDVSRHAITGTIT